MSQRGVYMDMRSRLWGLVWQLPEEWPGAWGMMAMNLLDEIIIDSGENLPAEFHFALHVLMNDAPIEHLQRRHWCLPKTIPLYRLEKKY